jgi:hypothetical protein
MDIEYANSDFLEQEGIHCEGEEKEMVTIGPKNEFFELLQGVFIATDATMLELENEVLTNYAKMDGDCILYPIKEATSLNDVFCYKLYFKP